MEWFRLKKKEMQIDQNQQKGERGGEQERIIEHTHHTVANTQEEECPLDLSTSYYKTKSNLEKVNLEHLRKQIKNLIDIQSQTVKEIELQIKRSQRYLLD